MNRFPSVILAAVGVVALVSVAAAQMRGAPGVGRHGGMGPGMMGGGVNCPGMETTATQITEEKAKELAQQYADQYLAGFTVERVLPFTGMRHTMYSVELKNPQGELRTLHITPFGGVRPFGGPRRERA